MRSASWRCLKPLRSLSDRMDCASFRCPRPLEWTFTGSTSGAGIIAAITASSSSNDRWQRRHRLLDVRNCTKKQRSHRTTSRESTGVRVVAIQVLRVPERATLKANCSVICWIGPVDVKTKIGKNKTLTLENNNQAREIR